MDPEAALAIIRDADGYDSHDRIEACVSLKHWLRNGGYIPQGMFQFGQSYGGHQAATAAALRLVEHELALIICPPASSDAMERSLSPWD